MTYSKEKSKKSFSRQNFTLMEIVVVLVIVVLVSGITIAAIKMPVFATLDKTAKSVRKIFADAQRQTLLQGHEVIVAYDPENRSFSLTSSSSETEGTPLIPINPGFDSETPHSLKSLKIPNQIEVEFPDYYEETVEYRFFPDGSASGPELTLILKGRKMTVGVSRLTGIAYSREEK